MLKEKNGALAKMPEHNVLVDTKEEMKFIIKKAKKHILAWKAHLLRSINQDEARLDTTEALNETSVFLVQDWAMKFIPRKFSKGLSCHITVGTRRASDSEQPEMMTFSLVFQLGSQDNYAVLAIMSNVVGKLKKIMPNIKPSSMNRITQGVNAVDRQLL